MLFSPETYEEHLALNRYVVRKVRGILIAFPGDYKYSFLIVHQNSTSSFLKASLCVEFETLYQWTFLTLLHYSPLAYLARWMDLFTMYDSITLPIGDLKNIGSQLWNFINVDTFHCTMSKITLINYITSLIRKISKYWKLLSSCKFSSQSLNFITDNKYRQLFFSKWQILIFLMSPKYPHLTIDSLSLLYF